jgi:hypothetical protein
MPYLRSGKCVYKKKKDGSRGKKVGCSSSKEKAKKYLKKLYSVEEGKTVKITRRQLVQIIKEAIGDDSAGWPSVPQNHPKSGVRFIKTRDRGTVRVYPGDPGYPEEGKADMPLVKRGGQHDKKEGYKYYKHHGVWVRDDYNPRTDYDNTLDSVLAKMGIGL